MKIGIISNIYLIIFLPLISSLLCQIFTKKSLPLLITLFSLILVFFLTLRVFPDILIYEKIDNNFSSSLLSAMLEFRLDLLGIIFLLLVTFLKIIILFYYRKDIEKSLDEKNHKLFYSIYLLSFFALVGIFTTNNLLNLFFFFEIYAFSFFTTSAISENLKIAKLSFQYFVLNSIAALITLFCFLVIYLSFAEINFDKIAEIFIVTKAIDNWFLPTIFLLLAIAFTLKFFSFWLSLQNLKSSDLIANFLTIDALFIKTNVGIFVTLKFLYFFFSSNSSLTNFHPQLILLLLALLLIFYSSVKLYQKKHLKTIAAYFCLNNFGFIVGCLALKTTESMQALFFYLLNFNLTNLVIFVFGTFLKKNFNNSSINKIYLIRQNYFLLALPLKLLIFFIAAFPLSLLFFANWYLAYASFSFDIAAFMLIALIIANFVHVSLAIKFISAFFTPETFEIATKNFKKSKQNNLNWRVYSFYLISFWFLIVTIYLSFLASNFTNNLSVRFATFLLSNSL
ncbi:MAG: proton-conducting transporter membrane subunit [Rickettsiales bacterium]|nr:proton-conducting transporter membrane subunit [Rickettsiales bacterium]